MTDRDAAARSFIAQTDWADARIAPLAGDASNRRYLRLTHAATGDTAVLMDAPPERGEDTGPFVAIARYLTDLGLSAPRILNIDSDTGFLLIEDLGDALFARIVRTEPTLEPTLYAAATDVLIALHQHPPPMTLATYDARLMADMAALAYDWYLGHAGNADAAARAAFHDAIMRTLRTEVGETNVLIQRDYHAENLLWLPERTGLARVGLLDFQDAMCGHPAYDLVSLLQDARRDVPRRIAAQMIRRYIDYAEADPTAFDRAYHVLGAQRNLRILGVFARLCLRDGKPHYLDLMPRVWDHLMHDLEHPALTEIAPLVRAALPALTPEILSLLREKCASVPTL
ncbi:phosphotransferase [Pseudohalocynthiibacter aestuariivivens]|uniref:Phosphotransferase n=1 Tax=Roseovarius pelagicus TaxID=2980108 RepID=A0ABY6D6U4_9RHOB|nr:MULTISPECIES: phosphotransferase [Rhodobacterales]QIE46175.1 phosphotransferase [Pseudohalocynthiibacter aestuariivivens]UXX81862.1 phosphotransferase [Roseovarius pelagicus]